VSTEKGSVFDRIAERMAACGAEDMVPLHIGDTYLPPAGPARLEGLEPGELPGYGGYAPTKGREELRLWCAAKAREVNRIPGVDPAWIQVTGGATSALFAAMRGCLEPGAEVLLTAPWWPVITTVCAAAGVGWREAPLYLQAAQDPGADLEALLEGVAGPGVKALYVSTPNNPSGVVLSREQLEQVAAFARRRDLLVLSDEAYEDFIFTGREHLSIAALPGMAERTVTTFSFSKTCALSGYRLGYAVAPPPIAARLEQVVTGSLYNAPTPAQGLVLRAMERREEWFPELRERYRLGWQAIREELALPSSGSEGGFFLFPDVGPALGGGDVWDLVDRLLAAGVSVSPGYVSGPSYRSHIRICFVSVEPERLREGVRRINRVVGRG